jgi:hypothetical protein
MRLTQYIANQPLLALMILLVGGYLEEQDERETTTTPIQIDARLNNGTDCEMTKIRRRKIILIDEDEHINVALVDEKLHKRNLSLSPTNKYYKSILKNKCPGVVLRDYKDIEYD